MLSRDEENMMTEITDLPMRYARLTTAFVSDVLRIGGLPHGVIHHSVHRMISKKTIAGRALNETAPKRICGSPPR